MAAPPDRVWGALARPDRFPGIWPWLRDFDGRELRAGVTWACAVQPPVPYRVRFDLHLVEVVEGERIDAEVDGDVAGTARLTLERAGDDEGRPAREVGTVLHLVSELSPANGLLKGVLVVAPPVARFGHDWILDTGARQFRERQL
jgi:uncharacterized protein YndB with AHSA1/START domain